MTLLDIYQAQLSAAQQAVSADQAKLREPKPYRGGLPMAAYQTEMGKFYKAQEAVSADLKEQQAQVSFWQNQVNYWTPRLTPDAQLAVAVGQTLQTVQAQADQTIIAGGGSAPQTQPDHRTTAGGGNSHYAGLPAQLKPGGALPAGSTNPATTQQYIKAGYVPPAWMATQIGPQIGAPIAALQPKQNIPGGAAVRITPHGNGSNANPPRPIPQPVQGLHSDPMIRVSPKPTVTPASHPAGNVAAISAAQTSIVNVKALAAHQANSGTTGSMANLGQAPSAAVVAPTPAATSATITPVTQAAVAGKAAQSTASQHHGLLGLVGLAATIIGGLFS